tara:strand:- start:317 stop:592 length:276 start_codon:yes stop_codon:yes gene_type:complete
MPVKRRSQKAGGSCSYVNQKPSGNRRRSQRAGSCGYTGDAPRAGARRSMKGGGRGHNHKKHGTNKRSRKSKSNNRKRVVVCPAPDGSCRRR